MRRATFLHCAASRVGAIITIALLGLAGQASTAAAEAAASSCQPVRAHAAGLSEHRVQSGGRTRSFSLYVPRSYSGERAVRMVLDLHASGISPAIELKVTGMEKAAEEKGFVVVLPAAVTPFPQGGTTWNIPYGGTGVDDVAFIKDVLATAKGLLCIDETRVYAMGFSGGARLASELACRLPDRFAAIGAVGGLRHPAGAEGRCAAEGRAVPIIAFHSTDDPVNPYEYDPVRSPAYWTYGVEEAVRRWTDTLGCSAPAAQERLSHDVTRIIHPSCRDRASIVLYRLSGTGHTWPGSAFAFPAHLGRTEDAIDATRLMLEFFDSHRLWAE